MKKILTGLLVIVSGIAAAQTDDGRLLSIPVVFHIIYTDTLPDNGMSDAVRNSETGNSTSRLPREKILAELKDLDQDFQMANPDITEVINEYKAVTGNPKIHFALKDILYVPAVLSQIRQRNNSAELHRLSPPDHPESCLNVYISTLRVNGGGSEGVTNVPLLHVDLSDDFVNLNYSWVGLHYRLLSHETGHWLGLWHIDSKNQITISKVNDIPVQTDLTEIICVKCSRPGVKVIHSQRNSFSVPNTNNYMDYSGCRRMFSIQQSKYMREIIMKLRPAIWNAVAAADH